MISQLDASVVPLEQSVQDKNRPVKQDFNSFMNEKNRAQQTNISYAEPSDIKFSDISNPQTALHTNLSENQLVFSEQAHQAQLHHLGLPSNSQTNVRNLTQNLLYQSPIVANGIIGSVLNQSMAVNFNITGIESALPQITSRIFELGAIGSGLLSYISSSISTAPAVNVNSIDAFGALEKSSRPTSYHSHNQNLAIFPTLTTTIQMSQLYQHNGLQTKQQSSTSIKNIETASFATPIQVAEITKRSFMWTTANQQKTLWIRDYSIDGQLDEQTFTRLSEFIKNHETELQRVFLNGKMLWQHQGDIR